MLELTSAVALAAADRLRGADTGHREHQLQARLDAADGTRQSHHIWENWQRHTASLAGADGVAVPCAACFADHPPP